MAEAHDEILQRIEKHVADARAVQDAVMDSETSRTEARLDLTIKELQQRVEEQQAALKELRRSSQTDIGSAAIASENPREKLRQMLALKTAYLHLAPTTPFLPQKDSVLPSLVAARTLQENIVGTKQTIASTQEQVEKQEAALRREEVNLRDAKLIHNAMETRINALRKRREDRLQKTPAQLAKDLVNEKRALIEVQEVRCRELSQKLNDFVDEHLSAMLAAEELGGPVVGDMFHVEDDTLAAGFTKKGKAKSVKKPVSDKTRQRRIDQIWGSQPVLERPDERPMTEAEAAHEEMVDLLQALNAALRAPGGRDYIDLERDSAASRFLVRSKIAQYHPRDAKKLRLIDFGKELDE